MNRQRGFKREATGSAFSSPHLPQDSRQRNSSEVASQGSRSKRQKRERHTVGTTVVRAEMDVRSYHGLDVASLQHVRFVFSEDNGQLKCAFEDYRWAMKYFPRHFSGTSNSRSLKTLWLVSIQARRCNGSCFFTVLLGASRWQFNARRSSSKPRRKSLAWEQDSRWVNLNGYSFLKYYYWHYYF